MGYQALLFCPDETTAALVTQVLTELEFSVEPANEPFAAVKRLTTQHFDAVVVDCDNEQNASLLFKSARNSGPNKTSLAVAVVEGQPGIAKAFRIGANLVLTKPINVEQSKGTLRVARGLLKKPEAAKPVAAAPSAPAVAPRPTPSNPAFARPLTPGAPQSLKPVVPPKSITSRPAPPVQAEAPSLLELENEPTPQAESADAALLESMPDTPMPKAITPKPAWPPAAGSKPFPGTGSAAAGAGVAPAREVTPKRPEPRVEPKPPQAPAFVEPAKPAARAHSTESHSAAPVLGTPAPSGSGALKWVLIAVALAVAAAGGYFASTKLHSASVTPASNAPAQTAPAVAASSPGTAQAKELAAGGSGNAASAQPAATAPQPKSAPTVQHPSEEATSEETPDVVKKTIAPAKSQGEHEEKPAREALVVKSPNKSAASQAEPPQAIPVIGIASNSGEKALAGIVEAKPAVPVLRTMKVSQGVSQGLILRKVSPDYPSQARQLRIEGIVQLEATVAKDGSVKEIKVVGGHPILARAAVEAVKQWKYKPYLLNGSPVEIETQISVNFKLP